jgi:hypothetical protein
MLGGYDLWYTKRYKNNKIFQHAPKIGNAAVFCKILTGVGKNTKLVCLNLRILLLSTSYESKTPAFT